MSNSLSLFEVKEYNCPKYIEIRVLTQDMVCFPAFERELLNQGTWLDNLPWLSGNIPPPCPPEMESEGQMINVLPFTSSTLTSQKNAWRIENCCCDQMMVCI